jgi:hypothetical protein
MDRTELLEQSDVFVTSLEYDDTERPETFGSRTGYEWLIRRTCFAMSLLTRHDTDTDNDCDHCGRSLNRPEGLGTAPPHALPHRGDGERFRYVPPWTRCRGRPSVCTNNGDRHTKPPRASRHLSPRLSRTGFLALNPLTYNGWRPL